MENLQYISQGKTPEAHLRNIMKVCEAGGKWVQLRLKNAKPKDQLKIAFLAKRICDRYGTRLIVNDNVVIAKKLDVDGVHLGLKDMCTKEAREFLGDKIIGGTANTLEDCLMHIKNGVDYIGLGPFRFTSTKKQLSPLLGAEGYQSIVKELRQQGHKTPVFAIGGIAKDDFAELSGTGVSGIAVSGILTGKDKEDIKNIISTYHTVFRTESV